MGHTPVKALPGTICPSVAAPSWQLKSCKKQMGEKRPDFPSECTTAGFVCLLPPVS